MYITLVNVIITIMCSDNIIMSDAENCVLGPCTDVLYVHGWHFEQIKKSDYYM